MCWLVLFANLFFMFVWTFKAIRTKIFFPCILHKGLTYHWHGLVYLGTYLKFSLVSTFTFRSVARRLYVLISHYVGGDNWTVWSANSTLSRASEARWATLTQVGCQTSVRFIPHSHFTSTGTTTFTSFLNGLGPARTLTRSSGQNKRQGSSIWPELVFSAHRHAYFELHNLPEDYRGARVERIDGSSFLSVLVM